MVFILLLNNQFSLNHYHFLSTLPYQSVEARGGVSDKFEDGMILLQYRAQKSPQPLGLQASFPHCFQWRSGAGNPINLRRI